MKLKTLLFCYYISIQGNMQAVICFEFVISNFNDIADDINRVKDKKYAKMYLIIRYRYRGVGRNSLLECECNFIRFKNHQNLISVRRCLAGLVNNECKCRFF